MGPRPSIDLVRELDELIAARLRRRDDLAEPHWRFWERRTLNLHRVVALCSASASTAERIGETCRDTLALHFRSAWWRGLGYGVVLEVRDGAGFPDEFLPLIDGRANPRGTWQWLILASRAQGRAWGLHTWIEGYLSPAYQGLLARLREHGFAIESARKEKDGLMRLLTAMRPEVFPEA